MSDIKPPFTDIDIQTADEGFYEGYSLPVTLAAKIGFAVLTAWALLMPGAAEHALAWLNTEILSVFNFFYIAVVGVFAWFLLVVALVPASGQLRLGKPDERPEFSTFSWFAMMFGAGLGVGLMVYSTAEPLSLWQTNPQIIQGQVAPLSAEALTSAFRYTFLHYGLHAWSIYVVTGLCLAYYAYTRDMPLTIRTALTPIFGRYMNGALGNVVDVLGVVATILGIAVTIGFGISQLVEGVYSISGAEWLLQAGQNGSPPMPSTVGLIAALIVVMGMSILSAVSGVGRGVKYLSNLNLVLSTVLLLIFVVFGAFGFAMTTYGQALADYVLHFPALSFEAYSTSNELGQWQAGSTTFYWAWWIAFSPFVGLFLARISRGRTIREFVLGAVIMPSLVCFLWMTALGGTAIDLEMSGVAGGAIIDASLTNKLFVTLHYLVSDQLFGWLSVMCVVLILTFLVTSADSGLLVINTIMAGGDEETGVRHRITWGVLLTLVIAALIVAGGGGLFVLQDAMIIGALPFSFVMLAMCVSLTKALYRDHLRSKAEEEQAA
ncbi:BCCT family transporter [Paracoccus shanxieyensis]|uniref:BCCT family transporter n=1 Tax=Paracoccus shanxieyensis TaxID=2675752 RepID=A0A6L6IVE0_9RHOB|nr:BCCT family transporter [Paracoccus shanxieyensis]MTH64183.1 BCCT family transporter [Paracoccus shanxieyensis]MTH87327.1 BCCT family transporter [Paracoccus shanxieyensis]